MDRGAAPDWLFHLLLALALVIVVGRVLGGLFKWVGQPPVIGEVVAGILIGPSLLGRIAPDLFAFILPSDIVPLLNAVAQLGVILYMFLVGLELNLDALRAEWRSTVAISQASMIVPFALGAGMAGYLYPRVSASSVPFTHFALFLGVAMSITAFPVLARILADQRMTRTPIGTLALSAAAVGDVTAWCLLAFVVGVVHANPGGAFTVALLTLGFIAVMFVIVRPIAASLTRRAAHSDPAHGAVALTLVGLLVAALTTDRIGVHALFGAFLFGAVIPHDSRLARGLRSSFEHLVTILLLPAFFAFAGMRTEIGLLSTWSHWIVCGAIVAVATVGKVAGTFVAARLTGLASRTALALGVLMNTRGLMELIVLNVGLDLGVISPTLFTMMVIMALVTTIATTPIVRRLVDK